jgi:hypothetical protein
VVVRGRLQNRGRVVDVGAGAFIYIDNGVNVVKFAFYRGRVRNHILNAAEVGEGDRTAGADSCVGFERVLSNEAGLLADGAVESAAEVGVGRSVGGFSERRRESGVDTHVHPDRVHAESLGVGAVRVVYRRKTLADRSLHRGSVFEY